MRCLVGIIFASITCNIGTVTKLNIRKDRTRLEGLFTGVILGPKLITVNGNPSLLSLSD